jgi:uncharacterized protein YndB with AHSA1/START domain
MKIVLICVALFALAAGLILALAAMKPDRISVQRSVVIAAPPAAVFALIDDLHNWPRWAPQDREDATMTRALSGAPAGVGAVSDWTSRGNAGAGRMEIVKSVPDSEVVVQVAFRKPFVAHNRNDFQLAPEGGGRRLTWSIQGTNAYMMKVMSVFVSPDRLIGPHFEQGLANLKAVAETR